MPAVSRWNLAALVALVFWAAPAGATVVPRLDLPELTRSSDLIVHGRVVRHWSAWDSTGRFIWTHYTLEVAEALKGRPAASITISEPGGTVGRESMQIAGAPQYADREEVVLFLSRTPIGYLRANGWGQGRYTVVSAPDGSRRIRTDPGGIALAAPPGRSGRMAAANAPALSRLNGMALEDFKRLVRSEVARPEVTR